MEASTETLVVTLSERDKRALRVLAAYQGRPMTEIVRGLIRDRVTAATEEVMRDAIANC